MSYETILFEVADNVATITLNRPDDANALDSRMAAEMFDASVRCGVDAEVRAVVITGIGKMFCVGGDLQDMSDQGDGKPEFLTRMATDLHNSIIRFQHMDAPVIMAVNGTAAGGGFSLALSGDYVMASKKQNSFRPIPHRALRRTVRPLIFSPSMSACCAPRSCC